MKKLFLFTVLVLAFAAIAYGQDAKLDFRASGFIDMRTQLWQWNMSTQMAKSQGILNVIDPVTKPNGGQFNRTSSYVDSRGGRSL